MVGKIMSIIVDVVVSVIYIMQEIVVVLDE